MLRMFRGPVEHFGDIGCKWNVELWGLDRRLLNEVMRVGKRSEFLSEGGLRKAPQKI